MPFFTSTYSSHGVFRSWEYQHSGTDRKDAMNPAKEKGLLAGEPEKLMKTQQEYSHPAWRSIIAWPVIAPMQAVKWMLSWTVWHIEAGIITLDEWRGRE